MKKAERIYLDTDKEILELIKFQQEATRNAEEKGVTTEDLDQWKKDLDEYEFMVHRRVTDRMDMEMLRTQKEERLLNQRLNLLCHKCGEQRKVSIIGEQRNKVSGTLHDSVECTVCQTQFVNITPNNEADQINHYKFWIDLMTNKSMFNETVLPETIRLANTEIFKKAIAAHLAEQEDMRQVHEYEKAKEQDLITIRDMLLKIKLSMFTFSNTHGLA